MDSKQNFELVRSDSYRDSLVYLMFDQGILSLFGAGLGQKHSKVKHLF